MPVTLADLLQLHAARVTRPDPVFDTDQVRWHGTNGKQGGWVVMHPEPRDGTKAHARKPFWTWPLMQIEGSLSHLRLLVNVDSGVELPDGWQEVANGIHLSYNNAAPALLSHLIQTIHPMPESGVFGGFDPFDELESRIAGGRYGLRAGMSLELSTHDTFTLYSFSIYGDIPEPALHDPEVLVQDPFLHDLLLTDGPEWVSC